MAGVGLLFLLALAARPLLGVMTVALWGAGQDEAVTSIVGSLVHALVLFLAFFALYTVVPHGERNWWAAGCGAVVATTLVLLVRAGMTAVLDQLWASYSLLYGPLALAALLLTWNWVIGMIVLFGASLASHVKVMLMEGRGAAEAERRHVAHKQTG